MSKADCPQKSPYFLELEPGDYAWCACGKSKNQPLCDGSHNGSDFSPALFSITEKKTYTFCGCKQTKTPPYCDGTHSKI